MATKDNEITRNHSKITEPAHTGGHLSKVKDEPDGDKYFERITLVK